MSSSNSSSKFSRLSTRVKGADGQAISYNAERIIGNGSFGVVFQATVVQTGEIVAIKKVLQDKRFKNRELSIMKQLSHTNIVDLKHCFYSQGEKQDEVYLNLVLEYVPDTVYRVARNAQKSKSLLPTLTVKMYMYQLFRSLAYIHSLGICHRDIKPQNLLVNEKTCTLKLCDFGSAKTLVKGEPNVSYICSRYYRAPELIFGATDYSTAIDVWSSGCVMAELLVGQPLFPGESGVDQLVEIIKVLGTPTRQQIKSMNPNYTEFKFPHLPKNPWDRVFRPRTPENAVALVSKVLTYEPKNRVSAIEALCSPFFDELRDSKFVLKSEDGVAVQNAPPLFNFGGPEMRYVTPEMADKLIPEHHRDASNWPPVLGDKALEGIRTSSNSSESRGKGNGNTKK